MININMAGFHYSFWAARRRGARHCRGQTLVEYALILAIISVVAIGVLINMGTQVKGVYSMINSQVANAPSAAAATH